MDTKTIIFNTIDCKKDELKAIGKWLYNHPETALKEFESSKFLANVFRDYGFDVEETLCNLECSFRATKSNGSGRRVCLPIEYDALPELGHACGHHLIATQCVATALGLASLLDNGLEGEVTVIGAPAEETGQGKPVLADGGVYDRFNAAMSIHPFSRNITKPAWIAIGGVDFTFTGKAAHAGSSPDEGVNALDALVLFYNGFSVLRQQLKDGTRIHGIVMEGGSAANIIPDKASIRLEFRSPDQTYFDTIIQKVVNCARGAAIATGCELEYHHYEPTCCGVLASNGLAKEYESHMKEYDIACDDFNFVGSTDLGNVSLLVPTLHPLFKVTDKECSLHTEDFLNESATDSAYERIFTASIIVANTLARVLKDEEFASSLKAELH